MLTLMNSLMQDRKIKMQLSLPMIHWVHILNTLDRYKDLDPQADRVRDKLREIVREEGRKKILPLTGKRD